MLPRPSHLLPSLLLLALGCSADDSLYEARIRWTSFGIPHIEGKDVPSVAYGQGFAFARDAGCILADQIVKVRSERSAFFGPGDSGENLDSDFTMLTLDIYERARAGFEAQPQEIKDLIVAYVAGYNASIAEHRERLPCGAEPWLRPIDEIDLFAHYVELGTLASARALSGYIAGAQPPGSMAVVGEEPPPLSSIGRAKPGSNGWALGPTRSDGANGMLLANPHFPWQGELKLWESHLKVPGKLDVYGVGLMGVVGVLIGFNEHVAWTHTVSDGHRFTFYKLTLDPTNPTRYQYDGGYRDMIAKPFTIDVLQDDGTTGTASRTMWHSHYGPILNVAPFGWTNELVISYRDANIDNIKLIAQFQGMNAAQSMAEFQEVHAREQGIPWVNTISTSAEGIAWYADTTPTPNLSQTAIDGWLAARESDFLTGALADNDVVLLDGGDSTYEWVDDPDARSPGLVAFANVPQIERDDFVFNSNDSHWLSNPSAPLVGYSPMHGFERTPRTPRTRMNMRVLTEMGDGTASGGDGRFDLTELQNAALSNRGMIAELLRDDVVARCQGVETVAYDNPDTGAVEHVAIGPMCDAIAGWDLRLDLDSVGAVAFREFVGEYPYSSLFDAGLTFATPFDADDPIETPNTLASAAEGEVDFALTALAGGALRLRKAGLSPRATLRDAQYTKKGDTRIPIHGGGRPEGITNLIDYDVLMTLREAPMSRGEVINDLTGLTSEGYVVNYGTSFIMTMKFTDDGPEGTAFLTYSESSNPDSEHYSDQTKRFSEKQWRPILYRDEDIHADQQEFRLLLVDE
ncbi:MAG: penicillin acylase family protein [Deltaproteobacteria bacterium]|nr:penicillin acylase family protein [Deltaproteobacteria bacterium]